MKFRDYFYKLNNITIEEKQKLFVKYGGWIMPISFLFFLYICSYFFFFFWA